MEDIAVSSEISYLTVWMAHCFIIASLAMLLFRYLKIGRSKPVPYGRYCVNVPQNWMISPTIGWFVQEAPAFLIPAFFALNATCTNAVVNKIVLGPFMLHYFFRSFIYPFQVTNGKPTPWYIVASAFMFCCFNGFLQGYSAICMMNYPYDYYTQLNFVIGVMLFLCGWGINIHSDFTLKNLRKTGETGYKIPRGMLFELISCANYFGEILEWWGYALASWSYPSLSFAVWSSAFLSLRAMDHHRYYQKHVKDYPLSRKAIIPFFL